MLEQIKEQPKKGADPCIRADGYKRILIEGISGQMDGLAVGETLSVVDDFYDPSEFCNTSTTRTPGTTCRRLASRVGWRKPWLGPRLRLHSYGQTPSRTT